MKICAVLPIVALATVLATISVSCTMAISAGDFIAPDCERKTNVKACGNTQDINVLSCLLCLLSRALALSLVLSGSLSLLLSLALSLTEGVSSCLSHGSVSSCLSFCLCVFLCPSVYFAYPTLCNVCLCQDMYHRGRRLVCAACIRQKGTRVSVIFVYACLYKYGCLIV